MTHPSLPVTAMNTTDDGLLPVTPLKPISDEICARCGEPIDVQPGETFMASTDGKVWHLGCSRSNTRTTPSLVTDDEG